MATSSQNATDSSNKKILRTGTRRKLTTWAIVALVVVAVGYFGWNKLKSGQSEQKLITAKVSRGDLVETVSATGSVTAQTGAQVKIGSQIAGRIKRLATDVGSYVKAGQLIAELDLPDLQAQLDQANASLAQAETRLSQQVSGVGAERTQTSSAISVAQQGVQGAAQKVDVARANATLQAQATPSDIKRASTALSTAQSVLKQVQAGANLQVATAKEQLAQAQANAANSAANLKRLQSLIAQGFVAQADVDVAQAQASVNESQVRSASQNVDLVNQKVEADLQASKDGVASAQATLAAARAETQTVLARNADVRDAQASELQARANLQAALANASNDVLKQQDVKAAQQAVDQARAQVAYNQAQMNKSFIRSPISGTVLQLAAQQGETVAAGLSTQTLIIVADLKRLEVDAFVDETDIGKVKNGQNAQCSIDAYPDRTFKGKVLKVASGSTIQQGVVSYDVTVQIEDPDHVLKPDMTANVTIQVGGHKDVLLVPAVAVQVGTRSSTVSVQKMVNGKLQTTATKVKTGGSDGINIEIVSGLNEGDTIVLAGLTQSPTRGGPTSPFGPSGGGGRQGGGGGGGGGAKGG